MVRDRLCDEISALGRLPPMEGVRLSFVVHVKTISQLHGHFNSALFNFSGDGVLCELKTVTNLAQLNSFHALQIVDPICHRLLFDILCSDFVGNAAVHALVGRRAEEAWVQRAPADPSLVHRQVHCQFVAISFH